MKERFLLAGVLLLGGYGLFVLSSGAPLRVHIARGITWLPVMYLGCLIYWSHNLTLKRKTGLLVLVIGLGSLLATLAASQVILKFEFGLTGVFGGAIILILGMAALIGLTKLFLYISGKKLLSSRSTR